jgi:hypothetical protein
MVRKEELKPIYEELQGYLQQADMADAYNHELWQNYHRVIALLNELSDEDFNRFQVTIIPHNTYQHVPLPEHVDPGEYKAKLTGLVRYLHAKYFPNEPHPLDFRPLTVLSQSQTPSVPVQMLREITEHLSRHVTQFQEGSKERGFIDQVRGSGVRGPTTVAEAILWLLKTAGDYGLNVEDMRRVFGG